MEKIRFIVRTREQGSTLTDVLAIMQNDPALELVDTIGPAGHPHTAVIATTAAHAPTFEQCYRHLPNIMIERDRPLSLFDKTVGFLHRSERNPNAEKS